MQNRRERTAIIIIVAVVTIIGVIVASSRADLNYHYPEQFLALEDSDFELTWQQYKVDIGSTPGEAVMAQYPYGKMLGYSTIFSLGGEQIMFTFTEDENIVQKVHIENPELSTARGTRVGDAFTSVIERYGELYAWVDAGYSEDFDAVYSSDNSRCIVFQVRDGLVQRIVLQNNPLVN